MLFVWYTNDEGVLSLSSISTSINVYEMVRRCGGKKKGKDEEEEGSTVVENNIGSALYFEKETALVLVKL